MSELTAENIFSQIVQLPSAEWRKLRRLLSQLEQSEQTSSKAPLDPRVAPIKQPDYRPSMRWLAEHAREYAGQWVALDGERLIAHGPDARAIYAAANADGAYLPLVTQVEDPDAPSYIGF
ncbi:MAG: DUF5678 domain-containing protein [Blastocatellia bacterium]